MNYGLTSGLHKTLSFNALIRGAHDKNSRPERQTYHHIMKSHNNVKKQKQKHIISKHEMMFMVRNWSFPNPDQVLWLNLARSQARHCQGL